MSIHVALSHVTRYHYDRPISLSPHIVRLRPAPHCRTKILSYSLKVSPKKHFINWQQDIYSNYLARLVFPEKTTELVVEVDLVAELSVINPFNFFLEESAQRYPLEEDPEQARDLVIYRETLPMTPVLKTYLDEVHHELILPSQLLRTVSKEGEDTAENRLATIDLLVAVNQKVQRDVNYLIRLEPGVQSPEETLSLHSGSCRDSSWLLVQVLRHLGFAARFVSGYLIQLTPDVKSLDGPSGTDHDFTDLHAWVEVYLPGAGWIGLDPTSGLLAAEGHLPLACTPEPSFAAPISGLIDKCEVTFDHEMSVTRIYEAPRVTKPYSEEQWLNIDQLGQQVDLVLESEDIRLTMGGEPTFVGLDNRDLPEWNTDALGDHKRLLSEELIRKLYNHFGKGGFFHFGQGKWYPGEILPRWALSCYWRKDGIPIWKNPALFANPQLDKNYTTAQAKTFIETLANYLEIGTDTILPAYEDTWYYLWRERKLAVNVDIVNSKLRDKVERKRLARLFEQGLDAVTGYILPVRIEEGLFETGEWITRQEELFLIPGDSPMGLRLPLDSLPHADGVDQALPLDTSVPRAPLAPTMQIKGRKREVPALTENVSANDHDMIRTALCTEVREGTLYIFMPPVALIEDYLTLVQAIETTAAQLNYKVILEGYTPPYDPRIDVLKVTPDPGVIEVNVHPVRTWQDLVRNTNILYEEARLTRLTTEKFMLDGRHTGTGGGNHFVMGGETVQDSPFLRRPDVLGSLIRYWHNHPSLSYLFSGMFIGPTSQAPRVDEARHEAVYELGIALEHLPQQGEDGYVSPGLVDRILRNLLVDVTGNTHRAEFCIDKLYSPDSATGRLGLVELRAFEMPPHWQMSLTQQLLIRALIARFWKQPYTHKLVPWGTELHDRFLLPHFVRQDFEDVITELNDSGFTFDSHWFDPHFEFRFPLYGDVTVKGVHLELRQALEPWHVMGEEGGAGGTVRYVDSSIERVQIRVSGLINTRHVILCNGYRVPLHPTGRVGEYIAGVRYRAWQPASCLHPTIPVQTPLIFDIVDSWNGRAIGGCTYHVMHPGGRSHETFPINSYEAEGRRLARFEQIGHSIGQIELPDPERSLEYPFTMDLRRYVKRST